MFAVSGTTSGSAVDYFADYGASLEGSGFTRSNYFEGDGVRQGVFEGAGYTASVVADDGSSNIVVSLTTASN